MLENKEKVEYFGEIFQDLSALYRLKIIIQKSFFERVDIFYL